MAKTGASQIVVIGSSAGGIDALSVLVGRLEPDFPAPIVIAQHLDPRRRSHLPEILAHRTSVPVKSVSDRERLEAGVIYLVPANRDVEITDHMVRVQEQGGAGRGPKPSVDRLLETAAASFGEHLIAVILSGEGSDGAEGARSVKLAGGTVIIQDPRTAAHPSMPQSLAPTTVDIVAPLESIAGLLRDLLAGVRVQEPEDGAALERFLRQVREQTGIDFASYKRPTITRRLHRRMAAVGAKTLNDYMRYVSRNPTEYDRLASGFLIKVTEFFRDNDLFAYLRNEVIPGLIRYADEREREIRVWSAGCATGEEAYSLSILLAETLGDSLGQYNVRVFATDLDADAVEFARRGIYTRSAVASMPAELVDRYFQRVGDDYEIRKNIRSLTVFGQHDLAQRAPFPRIDLAVTRNVLIYFTPELQKRALQLFAFSLREGGVLVLGKAESVGQLPEYFVAEEPRLKVYRRHGERLVIPPSRGGPLMREAVGLPPRGSAVRAPQEALVAIDARAVRNDRPTIAEKSEQILLRLPIGVVLVDAAYDIQLINGSARRSLEIHGTAVDRDFVHLANVVPSQPLREGIDKAIAGTNGTIEVQRDDLTGGGARTLRLTFEGHRTEPNATAPDSVLVTIEDLTDVKARVAELEVRGNSAASEAATLNRRAEMLAETNEELLSANHELTLANAELRSANEELLVGSEEVQAATEEVETLNEELQATNEELETLNEELQATVEELNTTNDDLEARSAEVERAAEAVRAEQAEHTEAISTIAERLLADHDGIAVITADGRVLGASELAEALRADGVRPVDEAPPIRGTGSILERVARGDPVSGTYEMTLGGVAGRYELVTEPLSRDGAAAGALIAVRAAPTKRPARPTS